MTVNLNKTPRYALHIGIYPIENTGGVPRVNGHDSKREELALILSPTIRGWVSGSWACWGTADQDTDGDDSLHVVVGLDSLDNDVVDKVRDWVRESMSKDCRLLDYSILSDYAEWSEQQAIVLANGSTEYIPVPAE